VRARLEQLGATDAVLSDIDAEARSLVDDAVAFARSSPEPV
jgi:TPP-dependent pyruvate/acetoin dehydrogenase alpha subunit